MSWVRNGCTWNSAGPVLGARGGWKVQQCPAGVQTLAWEEEEDTEKMWECYQLKGFAAWVAIVKKEV